MDAVAPVKTSMGYWAALFWLPLANLRYSRPLHGGLDELSVNVSADLETVTATHDEIFGIGVGHELASCAEVAS